MTYYIDLIACILQEYSSDFITIETELHIGILLKMCGLVIVVLISANV